MKPTIDLTDRWSLGADAKWLYGLMGRGARLRIPYGEQLGQLVSCQLVSWPSGLRFANHFSLEAINELVASGLIHKLTELGEPPTEEERKKQGSWRLGWRELGMDGDVAAWWVCTQ
jgi:hypothetical protein